MHEEEKMYSTETQCLPEIMDLISNLLLATSNFKHRRKYFIDEDSFEIFHVRDIPPGSLAFYNEA